MECLFRYITGIWLRPCVSSYEFDGHNKVLSKKIILTKNLMSVNNNHFFGLIPAAYINQFRTIKKRNKVHKKFNDLIF